jgi:glycosyltransferase involved in cell wall biosynthesis
MKPLRIVLVMIEPPLPFGNAVGRWYYILLKSLAERGHQVAAFATCKNRDEAGAARGLFPAPQYSLRCYEVPRRRHLGSKLAFLRRPHSNLFSPELRRDLAAELRRPFDVLQLESLWSGWLGLAHSGRALVNVHYLFQIDRADERTPSLPDRVRMLRTNQAEDYLLRRYPIIVALTPRLRDHIRERVPTAEIHTVPLGLDLSRYSFEPSGVQDKPVVTLIGSYNWLPSYSAGKRLLERLWPRIHERFPGADLQIVGRQALAAFGEYAQQPHIRIHENVPDTLPYFRDASVLVYAPGRGSGMKVKVLESFALGLPVVTTEEGVEGIPAVDGVHAGIANDDGGLIERTVALLDNEPARRAQSRQARTLIEEHCSPEVTLDGLEQVYRRVIERRGA